MQSWVSGEIFIRSANLRREYTSNQKVKPLTIPPDYLTIKEVQAMLGISKRSVEKLIDRGELSEARMPGVQRRRLVPKKSLHRYVYRMGIKLIFGKDNG